MLKKLAIAGLVSVSFLATAALADYNKGFKYYKRYITRTTHVTATQFVKKLNVETVDELNAIIDDNAKFEKVLKEIGVPKSKIKKILKKKKDIKDFLDGIMNGKIPAGC